MVTKVHEEFNPGQFLTGNLNHFTLTKTGLAAADLKTVVETVGTRATVVLLGEIDGDDVRVAVENNGAWTAATLDTAMGAGWTVTEFVY